MQDPSTSLDASCGGASTPTTGAAAASGVLDPQAVDQLRRLDPSGSNRLIERIVEAYRGSADKLVPQLRESLARGDHAAVRMVAHTLKSSSQNIGASRLAQLCAAVEAMVRTDQVDGLDTAVTALCAEVDRAVEALGGLREVRS
jgi:HPt (histidine-containing phosphotransfer) domain-containing protein